MEVILLQDVKSLGKKGDLVKVNEGYGRNYILPKKLGIEATNKNMNDLKLQKANQIKVAKEELEAAKAFAKDLEDKTVTVKVKSGEGGRIFGSISTKEIAKAAKEQLGLDIDKKKMSLDVSVKALGTYNVAVKLHKEVTGTLTVKVIEG
ncbi:MAG: 50S ribosomal protein L9 [Lachnospiraceae bacterium]|nr:50S ribosomal protein L9 [Lachnospiraceae bacterium]MBQ4069397.1 50S ribosomal protein L9 [Lachnospiraceae bacterium]